MMTQEQAEVYTGLGRNSLTNFARQIGARRKVGRTVLYDRKVIDAALDTMNEEQQVLDDTTIREEQDDKNMENSAEDIVWYQVKTPGRGIKVSYDTDIVIKIVDRKSRKHSALVFHFANEGYCELKNYDYARFSVPNNGRLIVQGCSSDEQPSYKLQKTNTSIRFEAQIHPEYIEMYRPFIGEHKILKDKPGHVYIKSAPTA